MKVMLLKNVFVCLFTVITSFVFAQQSLLVKITPPDSEKASYIFAANNNAQVVQYDYASIFSDVLPQVNAVAFEWLPENYELETLQSVMKNTDENTLRKYYKREDNIRYELFIINNLEEDVEKYWDLQPLYILQVFRNHFYADGLNFQRYVLEQIALEQSKPVISLFNLRMLRDQMGQVDYETQAAILINYVNKDATFNKYEDEKWRFYEKQNIEGFAGVVKTIEPVTYLEQVLNTKATIIGSKIQTLSPQQSTLYFINADILGGDKGLFQTLRALNYKIEDVPLVIHKQESTTSDITTENLAADLFPEIIIQKDSTERIATTTVVLKQDDIIQSYSAKYKAEQDPFGDMIDFLAQDTSFLNSWYATQSTEANLKMRTPANATWEETVTETLNGQVKSNTFSMNHARSDLFYSAGYTIYPPNFDPGDNAIFFDDIVYRAVRKLKGDLLAQRLISTPEYIGREITMIISDSFFVRSKIVLKGNILYQFLTGGPNDNIYSAYATAFFNSIDIESGKSGNWVLVNNNFFSCELPAQPLVQKQSYNTQYGPLEVQTFNSQDYKDDIAYFISVNAYPPGYNFKNTSDFYDDLIANAERQYVGRAIITETVKKNGIKGRYVELQLTNQKIYKMYIFFHHNIVYQYLAGGTPTTMLSLNPQYFFDHFVFEGEEK